MRRRRISPIMIAGLLALLSALGLFLLASTGNIPRNISPTEQQQTLDAIVQSRLTQTAETKATGQPATPSEGHSPKISFSASVKPGSTSPPSSAPSTPTICTFCPGA